MDQDINRPQQRKSKFSFSRAPPEQANAASNMAKLKMQFKVQIQNVINPKKNEFEDPIARALRIAEKLGVELTPEDHSVVKFGLQEYHQSYEEKDILGEGCIGLVKSIRRKQDGFILAVKIVKTSDEEIVKNMIIEFKNLQKLLHPNIVRMHEIYVDFNDGFQETSTVLIVMEKIDGKEMFEAIQSMGHYSEMMAKTIFTQILEAIEFMHNNFCCHRDLKPNNILCSDDGQKVKITDFNVSKFSDQYKEFSNINDQGKIEMWTYTGTVAFSAPEVFSGGFYNEQVDLWSAGCILYTMLSGQLPFNADFLNDLIDKITKGEYDFSGETWQTISDEAKHLISSLLQVDPNQRPSPAQALLHPWMVDEQARKVTLQRDNLKRNMKRLVTTKSNQQNQGKKIRARCYLFGAGEIWKRHSMDQKNQSIFDEFRKVKSFDIRMSEEQKIQVLKDEAKKNVYNITVPDFFSDDDQ